MSILEDIIYELADRKINIESKVSDKSYNIVIHLIKIYLWRDSTYKNHWIEELSGFINRIQKLKGGHRYPKVKDLYKWLWLEDNEENFEGDLRNIIGKSGRSGEYKNLRTPENINHKDIKDFVSEYMLWLSERLSEKGRVYDDEVIEKIDSLLKEHPYKLN